jgi:hypothetical protein
LIGSKYAFIIAAIGYKYLSSADKWIPGQICTNPSWLHVSIEPKKDMYSQTCI